MLPEYAINRILQKFGPEIVNYLKSVGFFELEGPYEPLDLWTGSELKDYVAASTKKNKEVWEAVEKYMLPEMELCSEAFAEAYDLKPVWNVADIAKAYFKPHSGELIKGMTKTDKNSLMRFIWANSGKNERPLARQILKEPNLSSVVDNSGFRARRIMQKNGTKLILAPCLQGQTLHFKESRLVPWIGYCIVHVRRDLVWVEPIQIEEILEDYP